MRLSDIRLALSKLSPVALLTLFRNVWAMMVKNAALFSAPPVTMPIMESMVDSLTLAIDAARNGGEVERQHRDNLIREAQEMLRQQADYVRLVAKGDGEKLAMSGFHLRKDPTPVGIPGLSTMKAVLMTGRTGEVEVRFKGVHGADSYQIWMTDKDPATEPGAWMPVGVAITKTRHLVDGLESYKAYWFTVSAIGAAGQGAKCDPAIGRAA